MTTPPPTQGGDGARKEDEGPDDEWVSADGSPDREYCVDCDRPVLVGEDWTCGACGNALCRRCGEAGEDDFGNVTCILCGGRDDD
jgi:hypothetical protein